MPVSMDPDARIDYWLRSDAKLPKETRPMFEVKPPTFRSRIAHAEKAEQIEKLNEDPKTFAERNELMFSVIMENVTGWRNFGDHPFNRDSLMEVLDLPELYELSRGCIYGSEEVGDADSKNSSSSADISSELAKAPSAEPAVEDNATPPNFPM